MKKHAQWAAHGCRGRGRHDICVGAGGMQTRFGPGAIGRGAHLHADLAQVAREKKIAAWQQCKVAQPLRQGCDSKSAVATWWIPEWKVVDGRKTVEARMASRGFQDPDRQVGSVESSEV